MAMISAITWTAREQDTGGARGDGGTHLLLGLVGLLQRLALGSRRLFGEEILLLAPEVVLASDGCVQLVVAVLAARRGVSVPSRAAAPARAGTSSDASKSSWRLPSPSALPWWVNMSSSSSSAHRERAQSCNGKEQSGRRTPEREAASLAELRLTEALQPPQRLFVASQRGVILSEAAVHEAASLAVLRRVRVSGGHGRGWSVQRRHAPGGTRAAATSGASPSPGCGSARGP